ncbi:MAG: pyrroloquinoline quinone-dependent dehydrogenase [Acidobacteria bacterium]|jgi:quinoprotein glucose dehydrogenase|nr:pyrroloquinoline quinone-dependent dehydrogenase [Acidobacteriota bacterium]MDP7479575.1 pyrroloquinoline quinone-dependent dehydrogenase [Vicinamibacterales bacterium]MDP7690706.1 pyrroloquinoline quinone-dependent dehydrogenase [Vicinamibacterales bacterium]HJN45435.1 pyrroloquinoline quinone-dependent dehydrogenase [Vicinamibacterales bacterium]
MMVARRVMQAGLATLMALAIAPAVAAGQQGADGGEWQSYAGDAGSTKYSPLTQITPENVGELAVAWRWVSVDGRFDLDALRARYPALQVANDTANVSINGLKGTPLMVGDTLYVSTPLSQVAAIDAATGETRWVYDPESYAAGIPVMVLGFSSRGLAYWSDGERERIVWATGDARLHAVDARTGDPILEFGDGGSVDLTRGIPRARRDPPPINYSVTSPPVVCNDVVIVGSAVSDQPRFKESPPGHVRGFDARTGELRWTFHTVPQAGEFGHDTWEAGSAGYTGNANVWTLMSADPELGYAYLPVGNATNDHYGGHRPGTNLFADSLVAVDCATGRRVWHFQMVHHDLWDYDPPAAPNLVDITVDGRPIKAVAQVTKHAFTFVFDRVTGEPVWPIEERAVEASGVPGEWTSPTQPFSTKPPPFDRQGVTEDDLIDFTPTLRAEAVEILDDYVYGQIFTPPSLIGTGPNDTRGTIELPGYTGGANWNGAAFDPDTGLLYVPSTTQPIIPALVELDPDRSNLRYSRGRMRPPGGPDGLPLFKGPYGRITALDLNRGEIAWQRANGLGSPAIRDHARLRELDLPALGGGRDFLLLTQTLLVSAQQTPGAGGDWVLAARDKATGAAVAEISLPGRAIGAPMTYEVGGRQYIAVAVRGARGAPPELVALALP